MGAPQAKQSMGITGEGLGRYAQKTARCFG